MGDFRACLTAPGSVGDDRGSLLLGDLGDLLSLILLDFFSINHIHTRWACTYI